MTDRRVAIVGTLVVVIHALINVAHGLAHQSLGVRMSPWQNLFILVVLGLAPLLAAVLLWTAHGRAGSVLLASSLLAAILFSSYFHYVAVSPDNVAYLPPGDGQSLFRSTALLLVVSQLVGLGFAAWNFQRLTGPG